MLRKFTYSLLTAGIILSGCSPWDQSPTWTTTSLSSCMATFKDKSPTFCDCYVTELKALSPNPWAISRVTTEQLDEIAKKKCGNK